MRSLSLVSVFVVLLLFSSSSLPLPVFGGSTHGYILATVYNSANYLFSTGDSQYINLEFSATGSSGELAPSLPSGQWNIAVTCRFGSVSTGCQDSNPLPALSSSMQMQVPYTPPANGVGGLESCNFFVFGSGITAGNTPYPHTYVNFPLISRSNVQVFIQSNRAGSITE
jgi:hypothetical protein